MSQVDTRQLTRDSLLVLANLRFEEQGQTYRVKVRNLSAGGMMGEGEVRVTQGVVVQIELRNIGWVSGSVAWQADGRFGVAFSEQIDPKLVRAPVSDGSSPTSAPRYTRPIAVQQVTDIKKLRTT